MGDGGEVLIRVAAHSDARVLARLIAKCLRERRPVALQAIGPLATYEAVRSLIIARLVSAACFVQARFCVNRLVTRLSDNRDAVRRGPETR
jgi:stage V sporulation protein SpoVS